MVVSANTVAHEQINVMNPRMSTVRSTHRMRRTWRIIRSGFFFVLFLVVAVVILVFATLLVPGTPSNDRDWFPEQAVLPSAEFNGDLVHIRNIRNFRWRTPMDYDVGYYDKTFDLVKLRRAYFIYTPFSNLKPLAHTFVSFEFAGPEYLSVSVEVRKEKSETYGWFNGLLKKYELYYVIADERDSMGDRAIAWENPLYVYPVKTTPERAREAFVGMLTRANALRDRPEFYHTFFNNCTTNLVRHVNTVVPRRVSAFSLGVIFPGYADALAYRLGLLDSELPFADAKRRFLVNERVVRSMDEPAFSQKIREAE